MTNGLIDFVDEVITSVFNYFYGKIQKKTEIKIKKICRTDSDQAIVERLRLERKRVILRFIFFFLVSALFAYIAYSFINLGITSDRYTRWHWFFGISFVLLFIAAISSIFNDDGNISVFNPLMVLELHKPYALYLRGFDRDGVSKSFSEETIVNDLLKRKIYTFAVGLPEEVDAPEGAFRVYVNNSTWQRDVLLLMKCASGLLVRVRNTESCVWELEQALTMLDKIHIIVDNLDEYNAIRQNHPILPQIDELPENGFVMARQDDNGNWKFFIWERQV